MARVNLEERLFADDRLTKVGRSFLDAETGLKAKALAIGMLAILWRISQEEGKAEATRSEIAYWLDLDENDTSLDLILDQLTRANYLSASSSASSSAFRICGNADQIAAQQFWKDRASKGGKAKRKKELAAGNVPQSQAKDGVLEASLKQALSTDQSKLEASFKHPTIQFNSTQFNSTQFDSIEFDSIEDKNLINRVTDHSHDPLSEGASPSGPQKNLPAVLANSPKPEKSKKEKSAGELSDGSKVWMAYSMAYEQRMRVQPTRNAKQNALCTQLVQRLGVEDAVKVTVFYLTHPNPYYMRTQYALGPLVQDCEGLLTQFKRGQYVTAKDAEKISTKSQNDAAVDRAISRWSQT